MTMRIIFLFCLVIVSPILKAQISATDINTINTAVPFLRIAPDARSGAMGDLGIAISDDANATYWNSSKLAFAKKDFAIGVTYTPWLKQLVNDIFLAQISGYKKVGKTQSINASLRFFSLGNIQFTDFQGAPLGDFKPREFAFDLGYSRALSKRFAIGISGRYIYSNLAAGQTVGGVTVNAANGFATDVNSIYKKTIKINKKKADLGVGLTISNIGTKMSYTKSAVNKDFIPANFGIGSSLKMEIDKFNTIEFGIDINKLLVPTPNLSDTTFTYRTLSPVAGAFSSFNDAPNGVKEEFKELMYSIGAEYWYNNQFALRTGFFYEDPTKGARKYLTVGLGIKYNVFGLNFSYLVPTSTGLNRSPLDNTLRFSLLFDFDAIKPDMPPPAPK
jgi:hypothetical protein